MKTRVNKAWIAALGLAGAVTVASGVAVGAGADDWYTGGNATVADPYRVSGVALKLYNAAGVEVTSGSTDAPLATFAGASDDVRAEDTFATLFVHLPQSDTSPGAWPGLQVTGTDKFSGTGAVDAPAALDGSPYVRTTAEGYTLADVVAAFPNDEDGASFEGVYELRLRTSSPTAAVSTHYAAAWVKVTGDDWAVTTAPVLGDGDPSETPTASPTTSPSTSPTPSSSPTPTASSTPTTPTTSPTPTKPAKKVPGKPVLKVTKKPTPKKAGAAKVTVATPAGLAKASGKVQLVFKKGKKTVKVNGTLKAGAATVKLPKLAKGSWTVTITYLGDASYTSTTGKAKVASK